MPQNLQPNFAHTTTLELLLRPSPMLLHQIERKTTRFWGRDVICHFAATKSCSCNARIMATAISSRKVTGLGRALSVPVLRQNVARFVTGIRLRTRVMLFRQIEKNDWFGRGNICHFAATNVCSGITRIMATSEVTPSDRER